MDTCHHPLANCKELERVWSQGKNDGLVDIYVHGEVAHAVDHIVEVVGQPHAIGNVEAQDEDIVQKLMDVIDDGVAAVLVVDDAGQVLPAGLTKMGRARDRRLG